MSKGIFLRRQAHKISLIRLECPICGETTFSDEVSSKLETLVNSAKKILQEISIIDYQGKITCEEDFRKEMQRLCAI